MPSAINSVTDSSPQLENSRTSLADNYEMFLNLLTAQMKNQDPLDPLDATQFVDQLVSFSGVEQQIAQNQNLESLLIVQSAAAQTSSVGYIGRVATALTPESRLQDGAATWQYQLPENANAADLTIRDSSDRIVYRTTGETTTGQHDFSWDGQTLSGSTAPDGVYTLEINAAAQNGAEITAEIRASARVTGIDLSGSEVIVEMGGVNVPLSSVLALQEEQ
ncbi:flagellar hook assembly protein FlgD [Maricaulis salignorans]|uniref:Basal-body rod modification protein FlgD n=1 Tax=Maricaulis salignorans TaxID=144026 RepID=A0A1G9MZW2_9PROT|nr:flagellar hook assembly protein FlgD [Maricaulis salignorans]SDL79812.1 flagellar basal-body rod modification protein FlgD [Maricaulis salignorans]